ncbi:MAG: hypothetical protein VXY37_06700, partial [Bacteroidota bacterium]|nr:hypothetical protein [Bacteroidota bacterium]
MIRFSLLFVSFFSVLFSYSQPWPQVGQDIDGESAEDWSGYSTASSSDGGVIAIGAPFNNGGMSNGRGHVRVYEEVGGSWIQRGSDIDGINVQDWFGFDVDMDASGTTLIIGAPKFGNYAKVYDWDGLNWIQRGSDIASTMVDFGNQVEISDDGLVIAISAPGGTSSGGVASGRVILYNWDGTSWIQMGSALDGLRPNGNDGHSLSLNGNGHILAMASPTFDANYNGAARIFHWTGSSWIQMGQTLIGNDRDHLRKVSLNTSGNRIAVGAYAANNDGTLLGATCCGYGQATVYDFDSINNYWFLAGQPINPIFSGRRFGSSVSLSGDGERLAISKDDSAFVYDWNGLTWNKLSHSVNGNGSDGFGKYQDGMILSRNSQRLFVGAPLDSDGGFRAGHVRVFDLPASASQNPCIEVSPSADTLCAGESTTLTASFPNSRWQNYYFEDFESGVSSEWSSSSTFSYEGS